MSHWQANLQALFALGTLANFGEAKNRSGTRASRTLYDASRDILDGRFAMPPRHRQPAKSALFRKKDKRGESKLAPRHNAGM
jgi:hypothetical protein